MKEVRVQQSKPILMCLQEHFQKERLLSEACISLIGSFSFKNRREEEQERVTTASPENCLVTHGK